MRAGEGRIGSSSLRTTWACIDLRKVLLAMPTLHDRPDFAERPVPRAIVTGNRRKTDMGRSEKEGVMTPEIWQALCRLNALPSDQREAAFLEAAPQLASSPELWCRDGIRISTNATNAC